MLSTSGRPSCQWNCTSLTNVLTVGADLGYVRGASSTLPYISSRFSAAAQDAETVENQKVGRPHRSYLPMPRNEALSLTPNNSIAGMCMMPHQLYMFVASHDTFSVALKKELNTIPCEDALTSLVNLCAELYESKRYVTPESKHILLKVRPPRRC